MQTSAQKKAEKSTKKAPSVEDASVRRMRLELTRHCCHYPLKVACIPISPPALFAT